MNCENNEQCIKKWILGLLIATFITSFATMVMMFCSLAGFGDFSAFNVNSDKRIQISRQLYKGQNMEKALKKDKPIIVWFYVDWCGYCQRFAPTFKNITKDSKIKKQFAIAYVNADNPDSKKYMEEYKIEGFPTIFLLNPKTGQKEMVDNAKLFAPNAKEILVNDFLNFAK